MLVRRILAHLFAGVLLVAALTAAPSPAAAAGGCSGALIRHQPIAASGVLYGYLDIYYNSATGNNCARTNATGVYYGVKKHMEVMLVVCRETTYTGGCDWLDGDRYFDADGGDFLYYAGPVTVYGRGHCISWRAAIYRIGLGTGNVGHCG